MGKYIGSNGLSYLWAKINSIFATKSDLSVKASDNSVVHKDYGNGIVETGLSVHEIDIYRAKLLDNDNNPSEVLGTLLINNDDGIGEILLEDENGSGFSQIKRKNGNSFETLQQALEARNNVKSDWNAASGDAEILNKPNLSVYAPIDSPALAGTPTAPTATAGTNTTQLATTAFVQEEISSQLGNIETLQIEHGTNDTTFELTPNVYHVWSTVASLTLTLGSGTSGIVNEYMFQFDSGSTATVLNLPNTISWVQTLTPEANKTYQVSIVNNIALWICV